MRINVKIRKLIYKLNFILLMLVKYLMILLAIAIFKKFLCFDICHFTILQFLIRNCYLLTSYEIYLTFKCGCIATFFPSIFAH